MRIFLAGATGTLGRRLVPRLLERGHEVVGTTRSPERAAALSEQGAEAVVVDPLDGPAVREAVEA
ncbi:MAG: SDR family oxidoreductase, partial [Solirubrobacteraceae bacterium]